MTTVRLSDRSGKTLKVVEMNGRLYTDFARESLKNTCTMKARPDDILLITYPKSGTHWVFEILRILLAGTTDLPLVEKDETMLEDAAPDFLEALASPRNINSHYHHDALSQDFLRKMSKIIYITRDPRDVSVSYYHHHTKLIDYYEYEGVWNDYFHMFMEAKVDYDSWFEHTKGWEQCMKENPDHPFLVLSFESLKNEPFGNIKKISDFIGTKHTDEFLKETIEKTCFNHMAKARQTPDNQYNVMYRKGEVGDWKNYFTVAQSEMFNEKFEKEMSGTNAYKLYSHFYSAHKQADANRNGV